MPDLSFELRCKCGKVAGRIRPTPASRFNHSVCYCDDCQAFAHALGRSQDVLDAHGGTRVLQLGPGRVQITKGAEQIRCLKLKPKGLLRFYSNCCKTPLGNTMAAKMPLVGIPTSFIPSLREDAPELPVRSRVFGRFGHGELPRGTSAKVSGRDVFRMVGLLLTGALGGEHKGSPYFDARTGAPVATPELLTEQDRSKAYEATR